MMPIFVTRCGTSSKIRLNPASRTGSGWDLQSVADASSVSDEIHLNGASRNYEARAGRPCHSPMPERGTGVPPVFLARSLTCMSGDTERDEFKTLFRWRPARDRDQKATRRASSTLDARWRLVLSNLSPLGFCSIAYS